MRCNTGRSFSEATKRVLWARSGGVCQYPGCADLLYLDQNVPKAKVMIGDLAHIIGFSKDGPRGDVASSDAYADDPDNLLFLCRNHHRMIDASPDNYPIELLLQWKERHETQVVQAAQLTKGRAAVPVILRSSQIGGRPNLVTPEEVHDALLATGFSAVCNPQTIEFENETVESLDDAYWSTQIAGGRRLWRAIRMQLNAANQGTPIAVFPRAEMPMLMAFGHMLGNSGRVDIFQYDSLRQSWRFRTKDSSVGFYFSIPDEPLDDGVALTLETTAKIDLGRIERSLGVALPIARLFVDAPSREVVSSAYVIEQFRIAAQSCLSSLESRMHRDSVIHVFPAMAPSLAFAFGTLIQPKVSNVIRVYDARGIGGVFHQAIDLPMEDSEAP